MSVENQTGESRGTAHETGQAASHTQRPMDSSTATGPQVTGPYATDQDSGNESAGNGDAGNGSTREGRRMLYRHPNDTVLGGVCGGVADYFGWDAALVRIIWVILTLATSGGGLLAYLALWILLPVGTTAAGQQQAARLALNERNLARAAWILIGLGGIWLLGNLGVLPWLWGGFWRIVSIVFWPLLLIGVGYVLLRYIGKTNDWGFGLSGAADQVRSSVNDRMPTREKVKSGFNRMRHNLPLKRSADDRIWMGVCGGIGQRLGIDTNLVRLIWAAFSVGSIGMGVLIYVLAGLFLVQETPGHQLTQGDGINGHAEDEEARDVQIVDATPGRSA